MKAHRRGYLQITRLQNPINLTSLDKRRSDLPNLLKCDSGSSYCLGIFLSEGSVPQTDAAALTRSKTFLTGGRRVRSCCQQSSRSFQTLSERPSSSAFAGFNGFPPPKTLNTTSDVDNLPNGGVPVSTLIGRRGSASARVRHCCTRAPDRLPSPWHICRPPSKACTCPVRTWTGQCVLVA